MKSAFAEGNYHMAEELADSINWKRVRNANSLIKAGEVYETELCLKAQASAQQKI